MRLSQHGVVLSGGGLRRRRLGRELAALGRPDRRRLPPGHQHVPRPAQRRAAPGRLADQPATGIDNPLSREGRELRRRPQMQSAAPSPRLPKPLCRMNDADLEAAREHMPRASQGRGIHDRARVGRHGPSAARAIRRPDVPRPVLCRLRAGHRLRPDHQPAVHRRPDDRGLEAVGRREGAGDRHGSGYQTAILAELARQVVSIERYHELSDSAGEVLRHLGYANVTLSSATARWVGRAAALRPHRGDGRGRPGAGPALAQLAEGGILVIPIGGRDVQTLQAIRRVGGSVEVVPLSACRFVPLVGAEGWPG